MKRGRFAKNSNFVRVSVLGKPQKKELEKKLFFLSGQALPPLSGRGTKKKFFAASLNQYFCIFT